MQNNKTRADHDAGKRASNPILIKRYRNRRLFNTQTGAYMTFAHLARLAKSGILFEVYDGPSGGNITAALLMRVVFEEDAKGTALLTINFLRNIIRTQADGV